MTIPEDVLVEDPAVQAVWKPLVGEGVPDLAAQHVLASTLVGLGRAGIAQRLSEEDWTGLADLVPAGGVPHLVRNVLRYLEIRGVVESDGIRWVGAEPAPGCEDGGRWRLTGRGAVLLSRVGESLLGFYVEAYGPVLARIGGLLDGTVDYGTDVERDTEALGRRCEPMTISFLARLLGDLMARRGAHSVLELGCGTGGLALHMARTDPEFRAIGLDIAEDAIALAERRLADVDLGGRVRFVVGDAFRPDTWPAAAADCDFYLAVGALHEQFRDGEDAVVELLSRYRSLLAAKPGRVLLLAEPELQINAGDAEYYLAHVLTKQGFPQGRQAWLDVIAAAGLRCERVYAQPNVEFRFAFYEITAGDPA
ncbi:SAM-dependent methyltransferase [Actinosynnema sp. NPDC059797]